MTLSGHATPAGTRAYAAQFPALTYRPFNAWRVAEAGFGSYRVDAAVDAHRDALTHALSSGINLIDTSSNYADGGSERLIGEVLDGLVASGTLRREQVVVVSKAGYLQGQNYALSQARKEAGDPFPDLVPYADGLEHCIHPDFLADQLTRSLARLNLETLDVYLLHNPEYYLGWAQRSGVPLPEAWRTYYQRIRLAFRHLESEVENGRIQSYGISSNTLPRPIADPQFTSLSTVYGLAAALAAELDRPHHFRVVQLPMNLFESGAATEVNLSGKQTVLDFAQANDLALLVNRPLNAIQNDALIRLADVPPPSYPATKGEVSTAVDRSITLERQLQGEILPRLGLEADTERQLLEYLAAGILLQGQWRGFGTFHNWRDVRARFILPRARGGVEFLSNLENPPAAVDSWLDAYVDALNTLLAAVTAFYQEAGQAMAAAIKARAEAANPDWAAATLSETAVRAVRSTAGVTAALVGMRQTAYVDDVLADLRRPVIQRDRTAAWQQLAAALQSAP